MKVIPALVLALARGIPGFCAQPAAAATEVFVAPGGSDDAPGTRERPFATPERARDEVRVRKRQGAPRPGGITVTLRGGAYSLSRTFLLTEADSGAPGAPITYRAYPGEQVRLTGGREIHGFAPVTDPAVLARLDAAARGKVLQVDLKAQGISDFGELKHRGMGQPIRSAALELFFDDRPLQMARWPNEGFVLTGKVVDTGSKVFSRGGPAGFIQPHEREEVRPGKFVFDHERLRRWGQAEDVWVHGYWGRDWSEEYLPVKAIDPEERTVSPAQPTRYGHYEGKRFYILNLLEEIDAPGEWHLDRKTGILTLWPPSPVEGARVTVSLLEAPLVEMRGVSHVVLRGLTLEQTRGDALRVSGGTANSIVGCTLRNIGNRAVTIAGGTRHTVVGCDILDAGDGGISLTGGDRKTLTPGEHLAENNHIARYSRWCRTYRPALSLYGCGNRARHNLIYDSAHMAITLGGNDHLVELNEIHSVVRETTDSSALYAGGDPTARGNMVRHNYWHHVGSGLRHSGQAAVYFDDGLSGNQVTGNVFYQVGGVAAFGATNVHGGKENLFENNLFIECRTALSFSPWSQAVWEAYLNSASIKGALAAVDATGALYTGRYPELARLAEASGVNTARRNLAYRCGALVRKPGSERQRLEGNLVTEEDPGFVDAAKGDFRLRKGARGLAAIGLEPIPFEKIGLYRDERRASWPVEHSPLPLPEPAAPEAARTSPPPIFTVPRATAAITLDGAILPAEWGGADQDRAMLIAQGIGGEKVGPPSHAWLAHDGTHLYVAIDNAVDAAAKLALGKTWTKDDAVELAFRNPAAAKDAPILVLRGFASGHLESSDEAGAPPAAVAQALRGVEYRARVVDAGRWTVEWKIPLASLGTDPGEHTRLQFNLSVRKTAPKPTWLMWRGTGGYTWRVENAGVLELAQPK